MSEVFTRLWKYSEQFDEEKGTLRNYVITMARNEAFRKVKSIKHKKHEEWLEQYDLGIEVDMIHEIARKMNKSIIHETIERLKEPDHQIFIRKYFWGERVKMIATGLGLEEKFVENRLYLVKKKMREQLIDRGIIL